MDSIAESSGASSTASSIADCSHNWVEEAFDHFTSTEIGKQFEREAGEKIPASFLNEEIAKLQAPRGTVRFSEGEAAASKGGPAACKRRPPLAPILKTDNAADCADLGKPVNTKGTHQQERLLELFGRCCALCNMPMSDVDRDNPSRSLENLSRAIGKAFKAKDDCYKYARSEQRKQHRRELCEKVHEAKWENAELAMTNAELSGKIDELTAAVARLRRGRQSDAFKIDTLTRQVLRQAELQTQLDALQRTHDQTVRRLRHTERETRMSRSLANTKTLY